MNICICTIGETNLKLSSDVPLFKYDGEMSHALAVKNAMDHGFTSVMIVDNATFDDNKLFMIPSILREIGADRSHQCVLLGGEHFGIVLGMRPNALFSINGCTWSNGNHAYVLRYSGMRKLANDLVAKPNALTWRTFHTAAVIPSIAHAQKCPEWVTRLPQIPGVIRKFESHKGFQAFLENEWQSLLKSVLAYIVFSIFADKIKAVVRHNCT